eukprot:6406543-Heterocapsa_arctica.AAC.1
MEVIGRIQAIKGNIDATIQDNPKWAHPSRNPFVIAFAADDRPDNHNPLTQTTANLWRRAAEDGLNSIFIYFVLGDLWENTAIWFVRVMIALALDCFYPNASILCADTDCGPVCMNP